MLKTSIASITKTSCVSYVMDTFEHDFDILNEMLLGVHDGVVVKALHFALNLSCLWLCTDILLRPFYVNYKTFRIINLLLIRLAGRHILP